MEADKYNDAIFDAILEVRQFYQGLFDKYDPDIAFKSLCAVVGTACYNSSDPEAAFEFCKQVIRKGMETEAKVEAMDG